MKTQRTVPEMSLVVSALTNRPRATIQVVVDLASGAELTADYAYLRGHPGTMYQNNGDPGDPPEPDELDLHSLIPAGDMVFCAPGIRVILLAGHDMTDYLSPDAHEDLLIDLVGDANEQLAEARRAAAEDRAERAREERQ